MTKPVQIKNTTIGEGIPKICIPLISSAQKDIFLEAEKAREAGADLVEWRADFFEDLYIEGKLQETLEGLSKILGDIPLIFTIRTSEEGGNRSVSWEEYMNCNLLAAKSGCADLVDVQVFGMEEKKKALIGQIHALGGKVIASFHDFEGTDDRKTLLARFRRMDQTEADILKMAVMPKAEEDVFAIMKATNEMREKYTEKPLVSMSMGQLGSITRISGENFGSSITFAMVEKASAPGQFPIGELRRLMAALHKKNQ